MSRRFLLAVLVILSLAPGCVRRRLTVRSNPPGAMVYVDDHQIGMTPVSTEFTYYGTRKIKLIKDGFETLTTEQKIDAPWYEIPPLDFVSENLILREVRDEREFDFNLKPQRIVPMQELRQRAENLRSAASSDLMHQGMAAPP
ncbi:MAG: PEGA domain-containing protein [Planctomycetota bacterium]